MTSVFILFTVPVIGAKTPVAGFARNEDAIAYAQRYHVPSWDIREVPFINPGFKGTKP